MREMGTVPLLTREGEVAIAKRIERGHFQTYLFRRRCLVARNIPLPTSSSYSLQGMSEKIHFQGLRR